MNAAAESGSRDSTCTKSAPRGTSRSPCQPVLSARQSASIASSRPRSPDVDARRVSIGTITRADGRTVKGFLCESSAIRDARDVTEYGGWRAYRAAQGTVSAR